MTDSIEITPEAVDRVAEKIAALDGLDGDEKRLLLGVLAVAFCDFLPGDGAEVVGFASPKCTCSWGKGATFNLSTRCPLHSRYLPASW